MVFVVLILGVAVVRLMAAILYERSRFLRAIISTAVGVGLGLWALHIVTGDMEFLITDKVGLMSFLNGLFFVPALLGVGASSMLVTLGCSGDGTFWSEYYRVGNVSYGTWDVGLGLVGNIIYAVLFATAVFTVMYMFVWKFLFIAYFAVQLIVLLKTLFTKE